MVVIDFRNPALRQPILPVEVAVLYHEKLDVYRLSIQLVTAAVVISEPIPKGYAPVADPLRRASISIPLNVADAHQNVPLASITTTPITFTATQ